MSVVLNKNQPDNVFCHLFRFSMFTTFILNFHEAAQKLVFSIENCHLKTDSKLRIVKMIENFKIVATILAVCNPHCID